uniref:Uncharacterized protein n=1 Tax=Strigamia maritima TaxID=126957 RepID=T1IRY9_STRMM
MLNQHFVLMLNQHLFNVKSTFMSIHNIRLMLNQHFVDTQHSFNVKSTFCCI